MSADRPSQPAVIRGGNPILAALARIVRIGIDDTVQPYEGKYIVLTNTLTLIALVIAIAYLPLTIAQGSRLPILLHVLLIPIYPMAFVFNRFRKHWLATTWIGLSSMAALAGLGLMMGVSSGIHYFILTHAVGSFILYSPRHEKAMWALALVGLCVFAAFLSVDVPAQVGEGAAAVSTMPRWSRPANLIGVYIAVAAVAYYSRRGMIRAERAVLREKARAEDLLLNILPKPIADRLQQSPTTIADGYPAASVLFSDLVGFTTLSQEMPPEDLVRLLNRIFISFDELTDKFGLEKIKTIGDAYMLASGLPTAREDHAEAAAEMAMAMLETVALLGAELRRSLHIRIGINSGPVVAGVIGKKRFIYDLWGDAVNVAARMESHGVPGEIHVSHSTYELLKAKFILESRGRIEVKGKGAMETYLLKGRKEGN
ncbi:MAG: adenylate/guanylate cyclase domain-containing protein [Nitrospirae bacterium]|nr:adenylate/guanylate cyclase domain-containing protein [Nitrospirota bacterium]